MSVYQELPFFNITNSELLDDLISSPDLTDLNDRLVDTGLREFLAKISKNEDFRSLDSSYYTCEHFKNKILKTIFHLNIHSLNSKLRGFCQFLDLLDLNFDIIVLSEIWSYNVDFYQNILNGYSLYTDLPSATSVGGIGMFIKKT